MFHTFFHQVLYMIREADFFDIFRYLLATVATVYATIITVQSLWGWYVWLAGTDRYIALLRRYVILHGLRLRFRAFWGDVLICVLLCVAFCLTWRAYDIILAMGASPHAGRIARH
jgi:hypothetical protein